MDEKYTDNLGSMFFIFCEHIPENAATVAGQVQTAEIVAIEFLEGNPEQRAHLADLANGIASHKKDSVQYRLKVDEFEEFAGKPDEHFYVGLVEALSGSGKEITFVDMSFDDTFKQMLREQETARSHMAEALMKKSAVDMGLDFENFLRAESQVLRARDRLVRRQLSSLSKYNPTKAIAVVASAVYAPYGAGGGNSPGLDFTPLQAVLRTRSFKGEDALSEEESQRALLEYILIPTEAGEAAKKAGKVPAAELPQAIDAALQDYHTFAVKQRVAQFGRAES